MEDGNYIFPSVKLDPRYYKNIHDFDERFIFGALLAAATRHHRVGIGRSAGMSLCSLMQKLSDEGMPCYVPNGEQVYPQGVNPIIGYEQNKSHPFLGKRQPFCKKAVI